MTGPLQGIKVFDLTHRGVGPWAVMLLASMGANVIKIEHPNGDGVLVNDPKIKGLSIIYLHWHFHPDTSSHLAGSELYHPPLYSFKYKRYYGCCRKFN